MGIAIAVAVLLVVARSAVYLAYPQSFFDSDQAIIGLMAKHLVEGRAFPLFYYGQSYMMGVDAWVAALVFLFTGPTVPALHAAIVLMNIAAAVLLVIVLRRSLSLAPIAAVAASIFFIFAPPFTAASLIEAGANIGPFLYVVILWLVRGRPLWFGAVLAFGCENREFTLYAVPALIVVQAIDGSLLRSSTLRAWLLAAVAFGAVWQGIEALKPFADMMGPGTRGMLIHGTAGSEIGNVSDRIAIVPAELPGRVRTMIADYFPRQLGGTRVDNALAAQGRDWLRWPLEIAIALAALRSLALIAGRRRRRPRDAGQAHAAEPRPTTAFGWYLVVVGLAAVVVYTLTRPATGVVDRYLLLALFIPIGVSAVFLATETSPALRRGFIALLAVWTAYSAVDHVRLLERYRSGREPDEMRVLADGLLARNIHVAEANYWRAYKLAFITQERVKVASTDVVRIDEYQRLAAAEGTRLIRIQEDPCATAGLEEGDRIGPWHLCREAP